MGGYFCNFRYLFLKKIRFHLPVVYKKIIKRILHCRGLLPPVTTKEIPLKCSIWWLFLNDETYFSVLRYTPATNPFTEYREVSAPPPLMTKAPWKLSPPPPWKAGFQPLDQWLTHLNSHHQNFTLLRLESTALIYLRQT